MSKPSDSEPAFEPTMEASLALRGQYLGPYRVVAELGAGGMGSVWYAEHRRIGRRVAIKVLHPNLSGDPNAVARFLTEARAVNAIGHPHIVEVTDIGEEGALVYLVMELLQGETLGARLEREATLGLETVLALVRQTATALVAAHAKGIVHRDLKPENIFLAYHDDLPERVKLLDFGIAKLATPTMGEKLGLTHPGMVLGTPAYMSPEQCLGDQDIGPASDQYALGVVIYEMLSGRTPFRSPSPSRLLIAHSAEPPPDLHEVAPETGGLVSSVVMRALAKEPQERFPSILEFVSALEHAVHPPSPSLPPPPDIVRNDKRQLTERRQSAAVGRELTQILKRKIAHGRVQLPSLPMIAAECMRLLQEKDCDLGAISRVFERDPLLVSRLLRMANSAALGGRVAVTSVQQAVSRLGLRRIKLIVLEQSARRVFESKDPQIRETFQKIWEHCLAVALIAREVARTLGASLDPDEAYLAGLLHDAGKPIVGAYLLDTEHHLLARLGTPWLRHSVWLQVVQSAHQDVSTELARRWKLPSGVRGAIEDSHRYLPARRASAGNIVCYANAIARIEGYDADPGNVHEAFEQASAGRALLGLTEEFELELIAGLEGTILNATGPMETTSSTQPT